MLTTHVLPALSTDHSPVLILLLNDNFDNNGCGVWKFSSCLVHKEVSVENMKKLIPKMDTSNEFIRDAQTKWEFLKCEIRKFTIDYSKAAA